MEPPETPRARGKKGVLRSRKTLAALLIGLLVLAFALAILANLPVTSLRETREFQGQVPPLAEDEEALEVEAAPYEGLGFAEVQTTGLECGVGVVFLTEFSLRDFQETGQLPRPQLHCNQPAARLPGSIAAVFVENQRTNPARWDFTLSLYEVDHPYAIYGLPATALFLVGGLGLAVLVLERMLLQWMELEGEEKKKE